MIRSLLLGAACFLLSTFAVAQTDYYWTTGGKMAVTPSTHHFVVTASEAAVLGTVAATDVKQYQSWPHKPYAVVEMNRAMTTAEVVASLGFDTDEVQVSTAFRLSDGFTLYPTRNLAVQLLNKEDLPLMEQLLAGYGVKQMTKKFGTYRVEMSNLSDVFAAANALQESGLTRFAHPDFYAPVERYQINDPLFDQQFQMHNTGQTLDGVSGQNDADVNALEAWGITLGSSSTVVSVIDDGLEAHEDFNDANGNSRFVAGFTPANNGNGTPNNSGAHGVSCAGSIAASHNNVGVRGVAPLVQLLSANIFWGGESNQDLADAISWSKNQGADVMSNSWGYSSCTFSVGVLDAALSDANNNGRGGKGCVITFATGNDYGSCVSYPGNHPDVIGVGAVANTGVRSAYSNYGPKIDVVAPSNNVGGPGAGVRTTDRMGSAGYGNGNYTSSFGGTSSATPVVSGVAALVLGFNPALTSTEVKNILYTTAKDFGSAGFDNQYGHGMVDAKAALEAAGGGGGGGPTCDDGQQNGQETGVDCGGPDCPACPPTSCNGTEVALTIVLDNYPEETSWTLTNDAGQTVASGGTYGNRADGSTVSEDICLSDGCYTFTINDQYGDGICCGYGNGSYSLTNGGTVLASGGSFGSSEATDFCVGDDGADNQAPTTPGSFSVTGVTDATIDISWAASSDNVGVVDYTILLDGTPIGNVTGTSATVTGLAACTGYGLGVRANDAAGNTSGVRSTNGTTTGCTSGPVAIDGSYFENGLDGWTDGGGDCYRYRGSFSYEGQYSMRLRDNSGSRSSMTSSPYNLGGLSNVEIAFVFYPNSMENGEDFWVQYNSGSGWQTVATYAAGSSFSNGSFYAAAVVLSDAQYNLVDGGRFRIRCDASANNDQVYIDEVIIRGNVAGGSFNGNPTLIPTHTLAGGPEQSAGGLILTPNPATDLLQVRVDEEIREISVITLDGRTLMTRRFAGQTTATLKVADLPTGMYVISVLTEEERVAERVVIRR